MISHLSGMVKNPMAIMTVRVPKVLAIAGWATRIRTGRPIMKKADLVGFAMSEEHWRCAWSWPCKLKARKRPSISKTYCGRFELAGLGAGIEIDPNLDEILPHLKASVSREKRIVGLRLRLIPPFFLKNSGRDGEERRFLT